VHKAERVQGQVPKGLGCFVVIWPDAKSVWIVDYGTKIFFVFRKKGVNTNPIIMQNLYRVLWFFGKEDIEHGQGQHPKMLPFMVPHWCTKTLFHNALGLLSWFCHAPKKQR
tara:strand:+ start:17607 stop:17939 length:333 start_codon:yes stop_codon:yes gene_type:complete